MTTNCARQRQKNHVSHVFEVHRGRNLCRLEHRQHRIFVPPSNPADNMIATRLRSYAIESHCNILVREFLIDQNG